MDATRTPARPPSVANRTKRGRGFGVFSFRLEAADDVDDENEELERVAARMSKRGSLATVPERKLELLHRGMRLRVASMRVVENKSRTGALNLEEARNLHH